MNPQTLLWVRLISDNYIAAYIQRDQESETMYVIAIEANIKYYTAQK